MKPEKRGVLQAGHRPAGAAAGWSRRTVVVDPWMTPHICLKSSHDVLRLSMSERSPDKPSMLSDHSKILSAFFTGRRRMLTIEAFELLQALWNLAQCSG